jgi:hypothetical protein
VHLFVINVSENITRLALKQGTNLRKIVERQVFSFSQTVLNAYIQQIFSSQSVCGISDVFQLFKDVGSVLYQYFAPQN